MIVQEGIEAGALLLVLLVVGWGFWLAALVGGSSSYAYARVLDAVGLIEYCDPIVVTAPFC